MTRTTQDLIEAAAIIGSAERYLAQLHGIGELSPFAPVPPVPNEIDDAIGILEISRRALIAEFRSR